VLAAERPDKPPYEVWFADGNDPGRDVQCRDPKFEENCPIARRLLAELLGDAAHVGGLAGDLLAELGGALVDLPAQHPLGLPGRLRRLLSGLRGRLPGLVGHLPGGILGLPGDLLGG
jgi:hypothetical protein